MSLQKKKQTKEKSSLRTGTRFKLTPTILQRPPECLSLSQLHQQHQEMLEEGLSTATHRPRHATSGLIDP
jgi:hypothetical protein